MSLTIKTKNFFLFFIILPFIISSKTLTIYQQKDDNIILAKKEISTQEKYHSSIKSYIHFVVIELNQMINQLEYLEENLKKGDLKKAQSNYIKAHAHYETIRPIVNLFNNIERIMNNRANYFTDGEKDYRFTGFHLIEYQLFARSDTESALQANNELLVNARDLKKRIAIENIQINKLVQASGDFIEMILETKLAGKENIYSLSDLNDIAANLRGSEKIINILARFINPETVKKLKQGYLVANKIIAFYLQQHGLYTPYNQLKQEHKMALYSLLMSQAELLSSLRSQLNITSYHKY